LGDLFDGAKACLRKLYHCAEPYPLDGVG
jgi:hypothetical protein